MSKWTDFRNGIEDFFQPEVQEAVNFAHAVRDDAKAEGTGDLRKAFVDGYTVYASTSGAFQDKLIAAASAFLLELLGDVISIVKKDVSTVVAADTQATGTN